MHSASVSSRNIVFEKSYINHAWGYQNTGTLICDEGYIWKYDLSGQRRDIPYSPDEKLHKAVRVGQIPHKVMNELLDLLDCVLDNPDPNLPDKQHTAYDAGSNTLKAYINGDGSGGYRGEVITLDLRGDYSATSSDKCVRELVSKLRQYMTS